MKGNVFRQNFWTLDGLIGVLFGLWIGRSFQLIADSGEYISRKVLIAILIGAFSYVLALFVGFLFSKRYQKVPSWLWITVLGAIFFSFNKYAIWYLIENWNTRKSDNILEHTFVLFPQQMVSVIFISAFLIILLSSAFLSVRMIIYCFSKLKVI